VEVQPSSYLEIPSKYIYIYIYIYCWLLHTHKCQGSKSMCVCVCVETIHHIHIYEPSINRRTTGQGSKSWSIFPVPYYKRSTDSWNVPFTTASNNQARRSVRYYAKPLPTYRTVQVLTEQQGEEFLLVDLWWHKKGCTTWSSWFG